MFREDTLVLVEMTTRDMMEARQARWSALAGHWAASSVGLHMKVIPLAVSDSEDTPWLLDEVTGQPMEGCQPLL